MKYKFVYDERLELEKPLILASMESWTEDERNDFYARAKKISEKIPEKIKELDLRYMEKYEALQENPDAFLEIMEELNDISRTISELNVLYLKIEGEHIQNDGPA